MLGLVAVGWEAGEILEDKDRHLEVIQAQPPKDREAAELLSER